MPLDHSDTLKAEAARRVKRAATQSKGKVRARVMFGMTDYICAVCLAIVPEGSEGKCLHCERALLKAHESLARLNAGD